MNPVDLELIFGRQLCHFIAAKSGAEHELDYYGTESAQ